MGRVIKTESTGKTRNQLMRTCAELLRHLSQKQAMDDEARDMAALLVLCLREIDTGIDESATVWEKRDYWIKAEKLRQRWYWVSQSADELAYTIKHDEWARLPEALAKLFPHFTDIKVTRFTRSANLWHGSYEKLLAEG